MSKNVGCASRDVSWDVDGIEVYGTLTYPESKGQHPGVVFVAGSGPTDRNWTSPLLPGRNGSGKLLAEALSHAGFICLRYDKRASGPHVKENLHRLIGKISVKSHVDELVGAVETLLKTPETDRKGIFVLTSSEGAIHALNYQGESRKNRFKGLILTGAPGRAVGAVARSQILQQVQSLPDSQRIMEHYDRAIDSYIAGKPVEIDESLPETIQSIISGLTVPANLPFARELWITDPARLLARIKEPVLILIGKKDVQVDWRTDGGLLEKAMAGRRNVTFAYPESANHVLKHDETPREVINLANATLHYNDDECYIDTEALSTIFRWLKQIPSISSSS
jgi:alpha-beta hydrolase superfamily lysophospholipase